MFLRHGVYFIFDKMPFSKDGVKNGMDLTTKWHRILATKSKNLYEPLSKILFVSPKTEWLVFYFFKDLQLAALKRNNPLLALHQCLFDKQLGPLVCTVCAWYICLCQPHSLEPAVVWWYNHQSACLPETAAWNNKFHWKSVMRYEWVTLSRAKVLAEGRRETRRELFYHLIAGATRWWWCTKRNICCFMATLMLIYWICQGGMHCSKPFFLALQHFRAICFVIVKSDGN